MKVKNINITEEEILLDCEEARELYANLTPMQRKRLLEKAYLSMPKVLRGVECFLKARAVEILKKKENSTLEG